MDHRGWHGACKPKASESALAYICSFLFLDFSPHHSKESMEGFIIGVCGKWADACLHCQLESGKSGTEVERPS